MDKLIKQQFKKLKRDLSKAEIKLLKKDIKLDRERKSLKKRVERL